MSSPRLDVRVVELAGPWTAPAGRVLAGVGASVVLVEAAGDDGGRSSDRDGFAHWHAGKESVRVDATTPAGRARLVELLRWADVLLDPGTPWDLPGAGLTGDVLATQNPGLVHVAVTPFGFTGPRAPWQATDLVVAALSGMMHQVGEPGGTPLAPPGEQATQLAGLHAAIAALSALRAARMTGLGQRVDLSATEAAASALEFGLVMYVHTGRLVQRPGSRHPSLPHKLFPARDGQVAGGLGGSPRMWEGLVAWLAEHNAADDLQEERWRDPRQRAREADHVLDVLDRFTASWDKLLFAAEAQRRRLPWAPVLEVPEVLVDEHLASRDFFLTVVDGDRELRDVGPAVVVTGQRPARLVVPAAGSMDHQPFPPAGFPPTPATPSEEPRPGPALEGVRVLDLSWVLAGPFATRLLGDHGADVVKVESARRSDPTRFAPVFQFSRAEPHPDGSGYFNNLNRNKRSMTLNLKAPEARDVLDRLVASSDVVIENYSAGMLEGMGFGYESLRALRPDVIYVSMSGLGHTGPHRDYVSYNDVVSALSGLASLTGEVGRPPVGVIFGLADISAGHHAAFAVLVALEHRRRTSEGCHVDLSQLECMTSQLGTVVARCSSTGHAPETAANEDERYEPHGAFPCLGTDRWCAVVARTDEEWQLLCAQMGREDLASDPRLTSLRGRTELAGEVRAAVTAWTSTLAATEVADRLQAVGVPAGVVQDGRDLVEHDPQLRARNYLQPVRHSRQGVFLHEGVPAWMSRTPGGIRRPAPLLGEHTDEVLRDVLGLAEPEIVALRAAGALE